MVCSAVAAPPLPECTVRQIGMHGMDEADFIDHFTDIRKDIADLLAALAILPEAVRRLN